MKRKLLLFGFILTLISAKGFAQNPIDIYDKANNLITGTTISAFSSDNTIDNIEMSLKVKNNTADSVYLFVRRIINSEVAGTSNVMCFGKFCYSPMTDTTPDVRAIGAGTVDSSFLSHYYPYDELGIIQGGTTSITYEFFNIRSSVTAQVTVNYHLSLQSVENGLKSSEFSSAYPNPASSSTSLEYILPAGSVGKLVLRNLLGSIVRELNLDNGEGKIILNTNDLKDGLYFYSILLNSKVELTRKLVIKH